MRNILPLALAVLTLAHASVDPPQARLNPTARLLTELIRVDTSNPPGNEAQLAAVLAAKFRPLGFDVTIVPTPQTG